MSSPQAAIPSTLRPTGLRIIIGDGIYLHGDPSASTARSNPRSSFNHDAPSIILVFGWMGAKLSHISKYTQVYEEMYPNATHLLIQSDPLLFWLSNRQRMQRLVPVAEVLEAHGCTVAKPDLPEDIDPPRILVHCFSNGGGVQMTTLGNLLRARSGSGSPTPRVSALVIDSCPGTASLWRTVQAYYASLSVLLRFPLVILITLLYGVVTVIKQWVFGVQPISERLKEALLREGPEGGILPWMTEMTPRMYICSEKDELIPIDQIEEHVEEARLRGLNAKIEIYEDTPHVAHAKKYPKRYWRAVKDLWAAAIANRKVE